MEQPLLSKISIGTGADYAHDTELYDPIISWNKIIEKQFGELAPYMKIFTSHSHHLEMNWVKPEQLMLLRLMKKLIRLF